MTLISAASDEAKWAAVQARDASFAGQFYLAVKTTGVYCRPGCPARMPKARQCALLRHARGS